MYCVRNLLVLYFGVHSGTLSLSNNGMLLFMFSILEMLIALNNSLPLKVTLLHLIAILSTWARVLNATQMYFFSFAVLIITEVVQ